MTEDRGADVWFGSAPPPPEADVVLFCVPHAGGGALTYASWPARLPGRVSVQPIRLPGRENRIAEPADLDVDELVSAVATRADRPYVLYGHSMGAVLAARLAGELPARGARAPSAVCVGAGLPPGTRSVWLDRWRAADDGELLTELVALGAAPAVVLSHAGFARRVLRPLRADLDWLARALDTPPAPLPVPLLAVAGRDDPLAAPAVMRAWSDVAAAAFRLEVVEGGHLFHVDGPPAPVAALVPGTTARGAAGAGEVILSVP